MKRNRELLALIGLALFVLVFAISISRASIVVKSTEHVAFGLKLPLDSTGIPGTPDSAHVFVYGNLDNISALLYKNRSTTSPFAAAGVDSTSEYGSLQWFFNDSVGAIDGDCGNCELAIQVWLWYKKLPTQTLFEVQIIGDSLNKLSRFNVAADSVLMKMAAFDGALDNDSTLGQFLRAAIDYGRKATDTSNAVLAEVVNINGFNFSTDSMLVKMAAFNGALDDDTTLIAFLRGIVEWTKKGVDTSKAVLDTMRNGLTAGELATIMMDTINARLTKTGFSLSTEGVIEIVHSLWGHGMDTAWAAGSFGDSAKHWAVTAASSFNPASDSVLVKMAAFNAALDDDTTLAQFLRAIILYAIALQDSTEEIYAEVMNLNGYTPTTDTVPSNANVKKVYDREATAARLDTILSTTNNSVTLYLKSLNIQNGSGSAIIAASTGGNGDGARFIGNGSGDGVSFVKGTTGKDFDATLDLDDVSGTLGATEIPNLDAAISTRSTFNVATESVTVDMSNFNTTLDDDSTLIVMLRAAIILGRKAVDSANAAYNQAKKATDTANAALTAALDKTGMKLAADGSILDTLTQRIRTLAGAINDSLGNYHTWIMPKIMYDSLAYLMGLKAGAGWINDFGNDSDKVYLLINGDTVLVQTYIHIGGSEGDKPDSGRVAAP